MAFLWCRTNLVNGTLYATNTCSPAHSHFLIAVTPHWVKACLHILALTRTLLFPHSFHLKPLSHSYFLPFDFLSRYVFSLPPSLSSLPPAGWWWCSWLLWFFPLLSQQIKRAGGADGCWQEVSSSSVETCNFVPRKVHIPKQKRKLLMNLMFLKLTTLYSYPSTLTSSLWVCCFVM